MTKAEQKFRNRIYWMQFILCILVIEVHSYNIDIFKPESLASFALTVERFISNSLGQIAVPGFFMVSAFLFYRNFNWDQLARKWGSRIRSLLIPYLIWNLIYYAAYLFMTHTPAIYSQLDRPKAVLSLQELTLALFHYKYNSVFWFMFQLVLLVAAAPVIYPILSRFTTGLAALAVVFICLMLRVELPLLNMDSLMYCLIGAFAALHMESFIVRGKAGKTPAFAVILLLLCYMVHLGAEATKSVQLLLVYRMTFPVALWFFLGAIHLPPARDWMKDTFFAYATHFLIIRAMNKLGGLVFPGQVIWSFLFYFCSPAVVFIFTRLAARLLAGHYPRVWALAGGKRGG